MVHVISVSIYVLWRARVRVHARSARANVRTTLHIQRWRPHGWTDRDPNWYKRLIGAIGTIYASRLSRVRIHVRAARTNVRAALNIQRLRPNRWTDRYLKLVQTLIGAIVTIYASRRS
jgi:hypothetical protein